LGWLPDDLWLEALKVFEQLFEEIAIRWVLLFQFGERCVSPRAACANCSRSMRLGAGIGLDETAIDRQVVTPGPALTPDSGNCGGPKVRDRLCQLIRQHRLDASLVKSYAVDFCGTKTLREASREQVENFVTHLADWAEKDRNALLCQLNSYLPAKGEGSAA
jgi:hypothetical protein